jgi:adenine-specific DNA-methyltransferase
MPRRRKNTPSLPETDPTVTYDHPESELLLRPEVGTQAQFRKKKAPVTYRYDSSLSPALEWDGQNAVRRAVVGGRRTRWISAGGLR